MTLVLSLVVGESDMITTKSKFVIVGAATLALGAGTGIAVSPVAFVRMLTMTERRTPHHMAGDVPRMAENRIDQDHA